MTWRPLPKYNCMLVVAKYNHNTCRVITQNDIRITLKYDISKEKFASMDCNNWFAPTKHVALYATLSFEMFRWL